MSETLNNPDSDCSQNGYTPTQKLMMQWQWPITFGPFIALVLLAKFEKLESLPPNVFVVLIGIALAWAVAFKGYLLYLTYQK